MALDPEDYQVLLSIAESLKDIRDTQNERLDIECKMLDLARLNARREFLLLTMSPDRVRDELVSESQGLLCGNEDITTKP